MIIRQDDWLRPQHKLTIPEGRPAFGVLRAMKDMNWGLFETDSHMSCIDE